MTTPAHPRSRRGALLLATFCAALLAACGGGGGGRSDPQTCSVADQKTWLRDYFDDWYFWYALAPDPAPAGYATTADYFDALLYTGTNANFPADRWSFFESTESFNRFFGDGQTLGYGVSVAGLEVAGLPDEPLYVRYVEPLSPAAAAGVQRGDRVLSMNGRSAADIITADDFSALTSDTAGQTLTLQLSNGSGTRTVTIASAVYALRPVPQSRMFTTPSGRKVGYVVVKDMISQVSAPLQAAFESFRAAGAQEVIFDLRYNGGGLVSTAAAVAGYAGGTRSSGQVFADLLYNDKRASANNQTVRFALPGAALSLPRAYVLTGRRTCSASEQVINGLRGAGITVVAIGETTCGKPVGFLPRDDGCGTTYSVVNFESVNARNEGRYFDGFDATCAVAEDFTRALGEADEPLLDAALGHVDAGSCPVTTTRERPLLRRSKADRAEPGERQTMIPR